MSFPTKVIDSNETFICSGDNSWTKAALTPSGAAGIKHQPGLCGKKTCMSDFLMSIKMKNPLDRNDSFSVVFILPS